MTIGFNRPHLAGNEIEYMLQALEKNRHISGDGVFTKRCHAWLEARLGGKALLTHSCTAALEMAALLCELSPGDEVLMPSFTFVSTANAVALRGAVPVFVDVREDTLNIDEALIEAAITSRTRAISVVHYAGVSCEMNSIMATAHRYGLKVIEDAAQALLAYYHGRPLGTIGDLAAISFHETKNLISGEGGALMVNVPELAGRAEIIREKGTNRSSFFRNEVARYTWVDIGSSYLPSDMLAAFLLAQMEQADALLGERLAIWGRYHAGLADLETAGLLRRPIVPPHCKHNGHLYYILLADLDQRRRLIAHMKTNGIDTPFHYVPLHSSPAGQRLTRTAAPLPVTDSIAERLLRLPMWYGMRDEPDIVIDTVRKFFGR